jgi:hypothetical protein
MFNISVQVLQVSSEDANKYVGEAQEVGKGIVRGRGQHLGHCRVKVHEPGVLTISLSMFVSRTANTGPSQVLIARLGSLQESHGLLEIVTILPDCKSAVL